MKTKVFLPIACILTATLLLNVSANSVDSRVALAIKVVQDVSRKPGNLDWTKAKKGDFLFSGDFVRTGERSIALVKFKDNSVLRVREKSELKVIGEQKDGAFSKTVAIDKGEFSFDIKKQENEQFTFTSPTSVASIRGTQGLMESSETGDLITVLEGLVNLLNTTSNTSVDVGENQTGVSLSDGTVQVRAATTQEVNEAESSIQAGQSSGTQKSLEIEMQDAQGNKKTLKIDYRD